MMLRPFKRLRLEPGIVVDIPDQDQEGVSQRGRQGVTRRGSTPADNPKPTTDQVVQDMNVGVARGLQGTTSVEHVVTTNAEEAVDLVEDSQPLDLASLRSTDYDSDADTLPLCP